MIGHRHAGIVGLLLLACCWAHQPSIRSLQATPIDLGNKRPEGVHALSDRDVQELGLDPTESYIIVSELLYGGVRLVNVDTGIVTQLVPSANASERFGLGLAYVPTVELVVMAGGGPFIGAPPASVNVFNATTGDLVATCVDEAGGLMNDVAVVDDLAFVTNSFVNNIWQINITEVAQEGVCNVTTIDLFPEENFVTENQPESNGTSVWLHSVATKIFLSLL